MNCKYYGLNITGYSPSPDKMVDISKDVIEVNGVKTSKVKDSGHPFGTGS
jgi:hypothetical protein